jgi:hypothetical protein
MAPVSYDSSPLRDKPVASEAPILSPQTIAATEAAVGQFQQIVAARRLAAAARRSAPEARLEEPGGRRPARRLITGGDLDRQRQRQLADLSIPTSRRA